MKKYSILIGVFLLIFLLISCIQYIRNNDGKFHITFCDVGQGDGILIRTPHNHYVIVDGGPDNSILSCVNARMPFWKRDIDVMILSHPHADHLNGLIPVSKYYTINYFVSENLKNNTTSFDELVGTIANKDMPVKYLVANDTFVIDGVKFRILGPTKEFLENTSSNGFIKESGEFGSLIVSVRYNNTSVLLTGDSQANELQQATLNLNRSPDIMQIPHHGSMTGIDKTILESLHPKIAVISVGLNNRYHHPNPFILSLLHIENIPILRTDKNKSIEFASDGQQIKLYE